MSKKYNVLLLVADQFRYDCQGYVNKYPVYTPNLDKLGYQSVVFDNAYTSIPTCCPARQSFYASKRCESFGAYWNYNITMPIGGLPLSQYSFMRDFSKAGYKTIHIGKPELSPEHPPTAFGYDRNRNVVEEYLDRFNTGNKKSDGQTTFDGWLEDCDIDETLPGYTATSTNEELDELSKEDKPFFMTVCFTCPHPPYHPHKSFFEMYEKAVKWDGFDDNFKNKPYIQKQQIYNWGNQERVWSDWEPIVRKYYAQITELDYHIGRILNHLKESNLFEDTIIIFTADHGDMCGSHKMFDKHYILYEDVIHVPLIIKAGNRFTAARTKEYTVHNLDLGPTLMELNGIEPSCKDLHGHSLSAVLSGGQSIRNEAVSTYNGAQFGLYTQRCIKTDKWKYIWNLTDVDELYDLEKDPGELLNLVDKNKVGDIVDELRKRLLDILLKEGDTFCTLGKSWAPNIHLNMGMKLMRN